MEIYQPNTFEEYWAARWHEIEDPKNVRTILSGRLMDEIVRRIEKLEDGNNPS